MVLAVFSGLGDTKEKSEDAILYNTTHSNGKYFNIIFNYFNCDFLLFFKNVSYQAAFI